MASVYDNLKRLFSTNVITRNVGGKKLKIRDTDHIQTYASRMLVDRFSRLHTAGYGYGTGAYGLSGRPELGPAYQTARIELFRDYDYMNNEAIIASALDIYADESTVKNEFGDILTIHSEDDKIKSILYNLFYDILNIEFNLWPWTRNMCQYGDLFIYLEIHPEHGIVNVIPLSVYDTIREEGRHPNNPYYVVFKSMNPMLSKREFENYEIAHFRLLSDSNFLPYGKSMIEPARRTWKQLQLMEDAMMIHRIIRAPEKRVFKIDVGNIPPNEVDGFMKKLITQMKRTPLLDPTTGDYNLKFNVQNITEDFFLPVRGKDNGMSIENIKGLEYAAIDDVNYLKQKLFAALKIPKAFLGYEEDVNGKATLAAQDVRFARTIERIQRTIVSELTKIAVVHLYALGYRNDELVKFSLALTNASTIYEQEKIELWKAKTDLAQQMQQTKLISSDFIYREIYKFSDDDIKLQHAGVLTDVKRAFRYTQIEQGQPDPESRAGQIQQMQQNQAQMMAGQPGAAPGGAPGPVGRPEEGQKLGTDSHPLGRDPFGNKENANALRPSVPRPKSSPFSESELYSMSKKIGFKHSGLIKENDIKIINNDSEISSGDKNTYMDETILEKNDELS